MGGFFSAGTLVDCGHRRFYGRRFSPVGGVL